MVPQRALVQALLLLSRRCQAGRRCGTPRLEAGWGALPAGYPAWQELGLPHLGCCNEGEADAGVARGGLHKCGGPCKAGGRAAGGPPLALTACCARRVPLCRQLRPQARTT